TTTPRRNREFWEAKFRDNRRRDGSVVDSLQNLGFETLVVWECETESTLAEHKINKFFAMLQHKAHRGRSRTCVEKRGRIQKRSCSATESSASGSQRSSPRSRRRRSSSGS